MLKLYKLKGKEISSKLKNNLGDLKGEVKNTIPTNKEWFNSIYTFKNDNLKLLPVSDVVVTKMLRYYFSMFSKIIEKTKARRKDILARKYSSRKIWISVPEIKHTNNKVIITLFIYNRQYNYFINKLLQFSNYNENFLTNMQIISLFLYLKIRKINNVLLKILDKKNQVNIKSYWITHFYKLYKKEITFLTLRLITLRQIILFNRFKFNTYIFSIKKFLRAIYKKDIEFNFITLKNFYLSSNIMSQIVTLKIKKRNKAIRVLTTSLRNITTPVLNDRTVKRKKIILKDKQNIIISGYMEDKNNSRIDQFLRINGIKILDNNKIENAVLKNTKNKLISGITLSASGRMTKRIKAEYARYIVKSIGTLKNVNSSFKGLSSIMVRGYRKYNIENTQLKSKTRVGAFGLKGWVSSY